MAAAVQNDAPKTFVLKLGGSYMIKDGKVNVKEFNHMATAVRDLASRGHKLVVVVGGGTTARDYISAAGQLGSNNGVRDYFGILVSRLNARLFIESIPDLAYSDPPESLPALRAALQVKPVVVLGGLQPGQSTTAVSALCAEYTQAARCIFSTDVDGVYTADPRKNPEAKPLARVSYADLERLCGSTENQAPGQYRLMDNVALTILERSKIPAVIIRGSVDNVLRAVAGETIGTAVGDEDNNTIQQ